MPERYLGRFAPSPTGPLHFGSLVAATASYLDAQAHSGQWIVRMEDVDLPRVQPGASGQILRALEAYGFEWHGPVLHQSARNDAYRAAFEALQASGVVYPCGCTRKEVADSNLGQPGEARYPGTCRQGLKQGRTPRCWRVRAPSSAISFNDRVQGCIQQDIDQLCGDFIVLRADGLFAYQLAVVVDDWDQDVTHVVRGADLLDSTPRQLHLQSLLNAPAPCYLHTPVVVDEHGQKLSKQTLAPAIRSDEARVTLSQAFCFLGLQPPAELSAEPLSTIWQWGRANWSAEEVPSSILRGLGPPVGNARRPTEARPKPEGRSRRPASPE